MDLGQAKGTVAGGRLPDDLNRKLVGAVTCATRSVEIVDNAIADYLSQPDAIGHSTNPDLPYPLIFVKPDTVGVETVHQNDSYDTYGFQATEVAKALAGLAGK